MMLFEAFLREVAPLLGLQARPFQKRGIKRRLEKRAIDLGLTDLSQYLTRIQGDPEEQKTLSKILTVTISRFWRDRDVFDRIEAFLIPTLIKKKGSGNLDVWSIGCASGEEPCSLSILWRERFEAKWPGVRLSVLATDIDEGLLERAKRGTYKKSSVSEVPEDILAKFFIKEDDSYLLDEAIRKSIEFRRHDIVREGPFPGMDIVFCRNLAFTYFSKESQVEVLKKVAAGLADDGYLVIGKEESLPLHYPTLFVPAFAGEKIYQKLGAEA